jgi:hypothetical protein
MELREHGEEPARARHTRETIHDLSLEEEHDALRRREHAGARDIAEETQEVGRDGVWEVRDEFPCLPGVIARSPRRGSNPGPMRAVVH